MKNVLALFLGVAVLVGGWFFLKVTPKRIDASSDERLKASIQAVKDQLSPEERERFEKAVMSLVFKDAFSSILKPDALKGEPLKVLDGMTAQEVIAKAEAGHREQAEKQKAQLVQEIQELESKIARAEKSKAELAKFQVLRSRFDTKQGVLGPEPVIELTVKNGTPHAISRAYFLGTLATPGRAVPWLKEEFNYPIKGGLESGEEVTWNLAPNRFSEWGRVEWKPDMVFTVDVLALDGADGKEILSCRSQGKDRERLESLRKSLSKKEE